MLEQEYKKIITFLNNYKINYLVIGGIAVSAIGNPRETGDIDFCVFIKKAGIENFFDNIMKNGWTVDKEIMMKRVHSTGCFNITDGSIHIDFIIASHKFERSAFSRKISIKMHGVKAYYPTPEDLILLKVVAGRLRDLADAEDIAKRYSGKLDDKYLCNWAQKLSDESENMQIYKEIIRLLKL